jgi:uncharacterized protein with PQ loop repeat
MAFEQDELIWTIIGTIFYIIAFISFIPETMELMVQGTNYGLSLWFAFGNSVGQWLLVVNFLCLNYTEFLGFFGYNFGTSYPALLVFLDLFTQWILFLPCIYLTMIVDDREHDDGLSKKEILKKRINCIGLVIFNVVGSISLLLLWCVLGVTQGFNSKIIKYIGEGCGYLSIILEVIQYVPQYVTTIKIKDNGSLSLLMLEIQGPSALANGLYMAIARHESLSTYGTSLVDAAAQIGLLIICLFFKLCKYIEKSDPDFERLSAILLQPITPVT